MKNRSTGRQTKTLSEGKGTRVATSENGQTREGRQREQKEKRKKEKSKVLA